MEMHCFVEMPPKQAKMLTISQKNLIMDLFVHKSGLGLLKTNIHRKLRVRIVLTFVRQSQSGNSLILKRTCMYHLFPNIAIAST